jgi:hypothetical protein
MKKEIQLTMSGTRSRCCHRCKYKRRTENMVLHCNPTGEQIMTPPSSFHWVCKLFEELEFVS